MRSQIKIVLKPQKIPLKMENNKSSIPNNTITRTLRQIDAPTGNIYESVAIIARRANQISAERKIEISQRLQEFAHTSDTLEETFENREQIEVSRHFERMPKPVIVATEEFIAGELQYGFKNDEQSSIVTE